MRVSCITVSVVTFVFLWIFLFLAVFFPPDEDLNGYQNPAVDISSSNLITPPIKYLSANNQKELPVLIIPDLSDVPSLPEIEKNITLYLHSLHKRLGDLAGRNVKAIDVWEAYLDVTKSMPIKWDDENKHRLPKQKNDNSIYVALGTYRDPYCPMTIKSLFAKAKHPEKLFIGLLQQNCFEKKCRTGVLVGGVVNDMDTDVDCYKEFCKSVEGQQSNACNTGQIRLFNVNESESLGPYMARYVGSKFYRCD